MCDSNKDILDAINDEMVSCLSVSIGEVMASQRIMDDEWLEKYGETPREFRKKNPIRGCCTWMNRCSECRDQT